MFNFIDPKFFELAEISGVGQVMENKKLSKMALFWKRSRGKFQIYFGSLNMNCTSSIIFEIIWLGAMYDNGRVLLS